MSNTSPNYITLKGFKALQQEFKTLFHDERPKLVETIAWAASNGDRSENGDYIYGKRRLRQIDSRLLHLKNRIEAAQVVDPSQVVSDKIVFGATVEVLQEDGVQKTYQIVGEDELEPSTGKISWKSPVAKALLGKTTGDEVLIQRPNGPIVLEVLRFYFK